MFLWTNKQYWKLLCKPAVLETLLLGKHTAVPTMAKKR